MLSLKVAARYAGFLIGSVRYSALVTPVGIGAFLSGWVWLVWVCLALVGLAVAAEVFASSVYALQHVQDRRMQDELFEQMWKDAEGYANGGWVGLNGSEDTTEEDGGEGEAPVPAQG